MDSEKNNWEKIVNITEEYQPNPDLAKNAIQEINKDIPKKQRNKKSLWISVASSLAASIIGLAIFLPIYFSPSDIEEERIYYSSEAITMTQIENINELVNENNLTIRYFNNEMSIYGGAFTTDSNKLVFVTQESVFYSEAGAEIVLLKIVVNTDADYYFYNDYEDLVNNMKLENVEIDYSVNSATGNAKLRFEYQNHLYFMEIVTGQELLPTIEKYVAMLLN